MASNDVKLGLGRQTGMFFHAPKGTALPEFPVDPAIVGENGDGTTTETFTAAASQTDFTLGYTPNAIASVKVNGAATTAYTVSGNTLTYSGDELQENDVVEVIGHVSAWRRAGDVTSDGITLTMDKSTEDLKNWANKIKRSIMSEHTESISCPIMDTTEETMKIVVGERNVSITPANANHGKLIAVNLSDSSLPDEEAFLFLMKDGDDAIAIGCDDGQITEVSDVTFAPESAINWTTTIKGLGNGWQMILDDGQTI